MITRAEALAAIRKLPKPTNEGPKQKCDSNKINKPTNDDRFVGDTNSDAGQPRRKSYRGTQGIFFLDVGALYHTVHT